MSRIEKGGTKFRPMMPRSSKDTSTEKPHSSSGSKQKPPSAGVPASAPPRVLLVDPTPLPARPSGATESSYQTEEPPRSEPTTQSSLPSHTQPSTSRSAPVALAMPSTSSYRPKSINMPGQRTTANLQPARLVEPQAPLEPMQLSIPFVMSPEEEVMQRKAKVPRKRKRGKSSTDEASHATTTVTSKKGRLNKRAQDTLEEGAQDPSQQPTEGGEEVSESSDSENGTKRSRRRRKPRPRVDKPTLELPEEGHPLDETTMSMKDLCNGAGQGRVSSRFLETFIKAEKSKEERKEGNTRLRELTRRKELGLPMDEEEEFEMSTRARRGRSSREALPQTQTSNDDADADMQLDEDEDDYAGVAKAMTRAPKVRLDASGEFVLDETEMEYDRQKEAEAELAAKGPLEVVIETDRDKFTNFASHSRKPRTDRWSPEETEQFYLGLRMFHTNFDLIARLLPNRTRTMVRNKYRAEDKNHPAKVTLHLSSKMRLPYDLELLSRETGLDFSGPIPHIEPLQLQGPGIEEEGDDAEKENEGLTKNSISSAPFSGGESDRGEGTSNTSIRGRSASRSKGKRKSSKSKQSSGSAVPPSESRADEQTNHEGHVQPLHNGGIRPVVMGRPPTISSAPVIRTSVKVGGGLSLPGGGRDFRRDE